MSDSWRSARVGGLAAPRSLVARLGACGGGSDPSPFDDSFASEPVARFFVERGLLVAFPQRRERGDFRTHTRAPGLNGHLLHNDATLWALAVEAYLLDVRPP